MILLVTFCLLLCSCAPAQTPDASGTTEAELTTSASTSAPDTTEAVSVPETTEPDFQPGRLPVLSIHIDGGSEEVQKMNESEDHSYRCTGSMDLYVPDGYQSAVMHTWYTEDNQPAEEYLPVLKDTVLDARYIPEEEVTFIEDLVFEETEVQVSIHDGTYNPAFKFLPENAIDQKIKWSVSDEALAMVDEENCVILLAAGDVTLTATLRNGKTASLLLHIKGD